MTYQKGQKMKAFNKLGQRPKSFAQAVQFVNAGLYLFNDALSELLDELKKMSPQQLEQALNEVPRSLEPTNTDYHPTQDAYLAASAEHLARGAGIAIPGWTETSDRFLKKAWFDNSGLQSLNATLLVQSPLAFRRRFIFTEARPLRRALNS